MTLEKYSIKIAYKTDEGLYAQSVYWTEGTSLPEAYKKARESLPSGVKLLECVPGHAQLF